MRIKLFILLSLLLIPVALQAKNGITNKDAAQIAKHAVGLITLTGRQALAADADQDGLITTYDAALVARYVAGIDHEGSFVGQRINGILIGDVIGDVVKGKRTKKAE